ncbi:hypothetical protein [Solimonas sp. SE-A11]|uniref:hypothetical protein n=1 Tax=Solimonas sp. SE-A11 TaxID=3054954 RepID=UPI00259C7B70|nr:hypothetical protein [Solimonas sp. SE-A11]MDM4770410.1 hypothetical protein [Solimonas sp. SE-A11]
MKRSKVVILLLALLLLGSNLWWAARLLDAGISYAQQGDSLKNTTEALQQALAVIRVVVASDASRKAVLAAAESAAHEPGSFVKEGYVWVGSLGLRFSEDGRLEDAAPAWSPFP